MGVVDAPQWLLSAWTRSCQGAGATAPPDEIRDVGRRLMDRWQEPDRHFHNIKHLVHVLSRVDELAEETHEPDVVRLAAWYHGAIFDAAEKAAYANRGGEDEVASAELARTELTALGVPQRAVDRVAYLVTALARHAPVPGDFDCAVLCDADLAVLAADGLRRDNPRRTEVDIAMGMVAAVTALDILCGYRLQEREARRHRISMEARARIAGAA